jgi:quinol monooxygenase YgiN
MKNNQIHIRAEFSIAEGKVEEYKQLIQEMTKLVKANEPDTIEYKFYLNIDGSKCSVHETYRNSKAAVNHNNSIASQTILPKIFGTARLNRIDVYGNPDQELREVLASFNAQIYDLFTGFSRE